MPQESSSELDPDDSDTEFAEVDPSGRYGRYKEVLGKGAFKKVYRAFDEWEGIEVAWNQVKVADLLRNSEELERLYSEVHLLKTLKHKNIIKFYNSWVDTKNEHINFITEIFTSGTLRQYRKKHKKVDLRAVKKWSRQILEGLLYLHSHDPPVIHRDLKCDNIFVNGNQGEVKIGDLGLAAILQQARSAHSVIGTPEFMAPELYEEEYNELVDIYAFGMCLLELVTLEYPYVECANAAQIFKKVTSGIKPASLGKVKDPGVKAFIEKCIAKVSDRVPAKELLMDPFLQSDEDICSTSRSLHSNLNNSEGNIDHIDGDITPKDSMFEGTLDFTVQGQRKDLNTIFLKLRIADPAGHIRNIHFPFDIECDTATAVAGEMVQELDLTDQDVSMIASMINAEIRSYIPDWTPRESPHEHNGSEATISEGCASDVQDDISPLSHDSFPSANLKLERLPSGKVYWSNSPKSGGGSSPLRVGPSNLSRTDSETPRDSDTEEDEHSPHNPSDEDNTRQAAVLELLKDECTLHNNAKEIEATLPTDSGVSEVDSANDPPVSNGLDPSEGNSNKVNRSCSDDVIVIVQKLEHLLSEQQIELDELKRKHALAVSNFLTELPPEISSKIFQNCSLRISDYKIHYKSCISPEKDTDNGSLKIKLENMHIGGKGGKHESVAGKRVFSPVFGSISNALKKKTQGGAGIAVIL